MTINWDKISEVHGSDVVVQLVNSENDDFFDNVLYLKELKIEEIEEIIERYFLIFLYSHDSFVEKVDNLINKLGSNYINKLGDDMTYWEELL